MANHDPLMKRSKSWVALVCITVKLHLGRLMYSTNGAFYFSCGAAGTTGNGQLLKAVRKSWSVLTPSARGKSFKSSV